MKAALQHLVHCCHGDDRPECPILQTLEDEAVQALPKGPSTGRQQSRGLKTR